MVPPLLVWRKGGNALCVYRGSVWSRCWMEKWARQGCFILLCAPPLRNREAREWVKRCADLSSRLRLANEDRQQSFLCCLDKQEKDEGTTLVVVCWCVVIVDVRVVVLVLA